MKTGLAIATLGFLLAGCGGSGATGNAVATATPDPMEAKIDALTDKQRKLTFYKAIYDADYQCDEVVKAVDRPRDNGHRAWTATCSDTGDYYITLQPNGVFTVSGTPQTKARFPKGTKMLPAGTK
ncbi:hypothetical protein [Sphingomonas sp.]|jgi:hypothetical protein|uniref:hypothetical protein n=1 Tax=Sphingomonas sp. TaxID=28214 RepID=UPI002E365CBE|nr:hypothetical protein [Sphingomonas sp.]HEX4695556.1 hypothetical protein [Sphingomonas sp.]